MRSINILLAAVACIFTFWACNNNDDHKGSGDQSYANIKVKSSAITGGNFSGAKALAVASKVSSPAAKSITKAGGQGEDMLYKLSEDNTFIEVTYNFQVEIEGEDSEVINQQVQASMRISPNFIFAVGDKWLWLANCFLTIPGFDQMEGGKAKDILNKVRDDFNDKYRAAHGAHFLIRKSDGAMFNWGQDGGAPYAMPDGYNPPTMLYGWFHAVGDNLYVREGGFNLNKEQGSPTGRVVKISAGSNALNYTEVVPASENVSRIVPGDGVIGVIKIEQVNGKYYPIPFILFPNSSKLVQLTTKEQDPEHTRWSIISVENSLYAVRNYQRGDSGEGSNTIGLYKIDYSGETASVGDRVIETAVRGIGWDDDKFMIGAVSPNETFSFMEDGVPVRLYTIYPLNNVVSTRDLPAHYDANYNAYIDGVACCEATEHGFYVCDLSKSAAQWVDLDWSAASEYQSQVTKMTPDHFEAAFMALRYLGQTSDGSSLTFWAPVTGQSAGKLALMTDPDGDPNFVIQVLLSL